MSGALLLVGTPIGNLDDLSPRAARALAEADVIACEDTRRTGKLLELAGIARKAPFVVVNEHTEVDRCAELLAHIDRGHSVVLVTDAGLPGISDPGEQLVRAALGAGHPVEIVPGPTAAMTALALSGMATRRFVFEGFVPRTGQARRDRLSEIAAEERTVVLYEAPHRLARTVDDLIEACGPDRRVAVARELTKLHEELWRGTLAQAAAWMVEQAPRGEVTLVLEGAPPAEGPDDDAIAAEITALIDEGATTRDAVDHVAEKLRVPRGRVYDLAIHGGVNKQ